MFPEIGSFVVIWMELESVIQSEISQEDKNKYHMLILLCEKWYRWTYLQDGNRDPDIKRDMWTQGRKGVGWVGQTGRVALTYVHYCI